MFESLMSEASAFLLFSGASSFGSGDGRCSEGVHLEELYNLF